MIGVIRGEPLKKAETVATGPFEPDPDYAGGGTEMMLFLSELCLDLLCEAGRV
jgi:hypothetical protein